MSSKRVISFCGAAAFVVVMFLASITFAQGDQADPVGEMDKDNDGKVSKSEWLGDPKAFPNYDKDSDGFIASDEKPSGIPTLDIMDKNGDGKITPDEFPAGAPETMFNEFDKDGNGWLSESEVSSPPGASGGAAPGGAQGGAQGQAPGGESGGNTPSPPSGISVQ